MVSPVSRLRSREDRHHAVGLGRPQSGHHFIKQKQLRVGGKRACDLEPLAVRQGQGRRQLVAFSEQVEPAQHLVRMGAGRGEIGPMQHRADDDIVLDRQCRKRSHQLKGASYPTAADLIRPAPIDTLTGEGDRTLVGREHAGDDVEQRRLARTVRTDDREDRALRNPKACIVDGKQTAKALADTINGQERGHDRGFSRPKSRASHGHTPAG